MDYKKIFTTDCMISVGDKILFSAADIKAILALDIKSGLLEQIIEIDEFVIASIAYEKDLLLVFSRNTDDIYIYNSNYELVSKKKIPAKIYSKFKENQLRNYIRENNCLYFYWVDPIVVIFDIEKLEFDSTINFRNFIREEGIDFHEFGQSGFIDNDNIFIHVAHSNKLLTYNLKTKIIGYVELSCNDNLDVYKVLFNGDEFYFEVLDRDEVKIMRQNKDRVEVIGRIHIDEGIKYPYRVIEILGNNLYLLPCQDNNVYKIDLETLESYKIADRAENEKKDIVEYRFFDSITVDNKMYSFDLFDGSLGIVDNENDKFRVINVVNLNEKNIELVLKVFNSLCIERIITETRKEDLSVFIKCIRTND